MLTDAGERGRPDHLSDRVIDCFDHAAGALEIRVACSLPSGTIVLSPAWIHGPPSHAHLSFGIVTLRACTSGRLRQFESQQVSGEAIGPTGLRVQVRELTRLTGILRDRLQPHVLDEIRDEALCA
ncbi:MAG: hypothetical protein R3C02_05625 [Planctomycetaceae bacterium]